MPVQVTQEEAPVRVEITILAGTIELEELSLEQP